MNEWTNFRVMNIITLKTPPQISSDPESCNVIRLSNVSGNYLKEAMRYYGKALRSFCWKSETNKYGMSILNAERPAMFDKTHIWGPVLELLALMSLHLMPVFLSVHKRPCFPPPHHKFRCLGCILRIMRAGLVVSWSPGPEHRDWSANEVPGLRVLPWFSFCPQYQILSTISSYSNIIISPRLLGPSLLHC